MSGTIPAPDEGAMAAAEYVLGVLDEEERRAVAGRAALDATLAADIAEWERLLAPLALLVRPVAPPAELWRRLQAAIGAAPPAPNAANSNAQGWRLAALLSMALAAGLAVIAFYPHPPKPVAVASLGPLSGVAPTFVARVLPDGAVQVHAVLAANVPQDRDLQLWALPPGATRPVSLGVLPPLGMTVAPSALTPVGGKLLISLEPKGGSPTGQPTGPVLYGGTINRL